MKKGPKPYNAFQRISSVFMILALVWLTISLPIVYQSQENQSSFQTMSLENVPEDNTEDNSNPFSNTTEEKNPNTSNTLSEEYLHDQHNGDHLFYIDLQKYMGVHVDTYIAYHGELHVPPPDFV